MVEMDMTDDCQVLTIHAVSFVHQMGPVFYASLPSGPSAAETLKESEANVAEAKHRLVSFLWDHLGVIESPLWKRCQSSRRAEFTIQVVRGQLGRPHLLLGKYHGPAISFSEGGGKIWAAICGDESDIGIDVAETSEFLGEYPFHRVFHPQELQHALRLAGGDMENASALLWSVKEAVVKALGCAFHLVDPLELNVYPSAERAAGGGVAEPILEDCGYTFPVHLSGKAMIRFPIAARGSLWVRALPKRKMWLSIALLNQRPACP
jgi:hypothetical protein